MTKITKSNIICISVMIGVLTFISGICMISVGLDVPHNGSAIFLTWMSGIALGCYLIVLAMLLRRDD